MHKKLTPGDNAILNRQDAEARMASQGITYDQVVATIESTVLRYTLNGSTVALLSEAAHTIYLYAAPGQLPKRGRK